MITKCHDREATGLAASPRSTTNVGLTDDFGTISLLRAHARRPFAAQPEALRILIAKTSESPGRIPALG